MSKQAIEECVRGSLEKYFRDLDGEAAHDIYEMVMMSAERPVLEMVMEHANGNQSVAAGILGINRNTLRKKLQHHKLI